jgi:hypothetical protein
MLQSLDQLIYTSAQGTDPAFKILKYGGKRL